MTEDILDDIIAEVVKRRSPHVPLYGTIAGVYVDFVDRMNPQDCNAMEYVGFRAIMDAGGIPTTPEGVGLFPSEAFERLGDEYDPTVLTDRERAQLALLGLIGLVGESLMGAEGQN